MFPTHPAVGYRYKDNIMSCCYTRGNNIPASHVNDMTTKLSVSGKFQPVSKLVPCSHEAGHIPVYTALPLDQHHLLANTTTNVCLYSSNSLCGFHITKQNSPCDLQMICSVESQQV